MTTWTCPEGHRSAADDYCDVCGTPIAPGPPTGTPAAPTGMPAPGAGRPAPGNPLDLGTPAGAPNSKQCTNCGADNVADALFCEDCGYDFTTGTAPPPTVMAPVVTPPPDAIVIPATAPAGSAPPAPLYPTVPVEWVAEVWVDPDWYATQESDDPCPSAGMPIVVPLHQNSVLIGRVSASRNIHPQIDCSTDSGVSRRHAQLTTDGQRWFIEDLQSANGTFAGPAGVPLPTNQILPGQKRELADNERVYVGAWTRIVIRRATDAEKNA